MLRLLKRFSWVGLLALGLQASWGFSLLGPNNETYQDPTIGYNPLGAGSSTPEFALYSGDGAPTGPKNLGEEYRRNTPVLYYAFDANFLDYFGSNGVSAVEQAFSILNGVTNVSQYSSGLSEIPLKAAGENYQAFALSLSDLKTTTLHFLVEQMGLAQPVRYTWALHSRRHFGSVACPANMEYFVIKRNFDPVISPVSQFQPSSYVNGVLYSYFIKEICTAVTGDAPIVADAVEFPVDPLEFSFGPAASVADNDQPIGIFWKGLTRDDVGGLRYLLSTNNVNTERAGPETFGWTTNFGTLQLLFTSNLTEFADQALTNDDPTLAALFPGLAYTGPATPIFTNLTTPNVVAYFTNFPWSPAGVPPTLVIATNGFTTSVATFFQHHFANVVTNFFTNRNFVTLLTTNIGPNPYAPAGSGQLVTNVSAQTVLTNIVTGDFFIIPPGLCDFNRLFTQLTNVVAITNTPLAATNLLVVTNGVVTTNAISGTNAIFGFSQSVVTYFTQHVFVVNPVTCPTNPVALMQGIERVAFVRANFDSLLGQFFQPITNDYTLLTITNSTLAPLKIRRVLTVPDIVFSARDAVAGPSGRGINSIERGLPFNTANALPNLAGPGTMEPGSTITFTKVGPLYDNLAPGAYTLEAEAFQGVILIWSSFDGTTNPPVLYPNGTSIQNLENQVLIQVSPSPPTLPPATNHVAYNVQFTAIGGQPPYTWSLAPGSPSLPPPLTLSASGTISGTTTNQAGTFDFVVRLNDSSSRVLDLNYSITIYP